MLFFLLGNAILRNFYFVIYTFYALIIETVNENSNSKTLILILLRKNLLVNQKGDIIAKLTVTA